MAVVPLFSKPVDTRKKGQALPGMFITWNSKHLVKLVSP